MKCIEQKRDKMTTLSKARRWKKPSIVFQKSEIGRFTLWLLQFFRARQLFSERIDSSSVKRLSYAL